MSENIMTIYTAKNCLSVGTMADRTESLWRLHLATYDAVKWTRSHREEFTECFYEPMIISVSTNNHTISYYSGLSNKSAYVLKVNMSL